MSDTELLVPPPAEVPQLAQAIHLIETAERFEDVQALHAQATAYAKVCRELEKRDRARKKTYLAAEIKLRCERRLGQMLEKRSEEGRYLRDVSTGRMRGGTRTLPDGITYIESHRWQCMAALPESHFVRWVAECKSENRELVRADLLRVADRFINEAKNDLDLNGGGALDDDGDDPDTDDDNADDDNADDYLQRTYLETTVAEKREFLTLCNEVQRVLGTSKVATVLEGLRRLRDSLYEND